MRLLINTIMLEKTRWAAEKRADPDLLDLLPRIAACSGYRQVEVWQYHVSSKSLGDVAKIREAGCRLGLAFPIVGAYPLINRVGAEKQEQFDRLRHVLDCAHALGSQVVKFFAAGVASARAAEDDWLRAGEFIREALDAAASRGLLMTVEAHGQTLGDSVPSLKRLLDVARRTNLKICFQPFDFDSLEQTLSDYDALRPDVLHVHLQNRKGKEMSLLSEGDLDYRAFLAHVQQSAFDDYLCVEFTRDIIQAGVFDVDRVLANAEKDRLFVEKVWRG
ncbi:MAG: sugar phosphate isomerase/epimerase [Planctomycetes bacterium]|nr:sugar phosphate isomerase/epimerase [Planctomycetota bacterium]